jgi:hypothetical protein
MLTPFSVSYASFAVDLEAGFLVIARSKATKQSISKLAELWIASLRSQ